MRQTDRQRQTETERQRDRQRQRETHLGHISAHLGVAAETVVATEFRSCVKVEVAVLGFPS